jgi:hypothetical protein
MERSLHDISKELHGMIERLAEGNLNLAEVDPLTEKARELYERLIALRYAAMQTLVKGPDAEPAPTPEPTVPFRLNQVLPGQTSLIDAIEEVTAVESDEFDDSTDEDSIQLPEAAFDELNDTLEEEPPFESIARPAEKAETSEDLFTPANDALPETAAHHKLETPEEVAEAVAEPEPQEEVAAEPAKAPEPPRMPPVAGRVPPKDKNSENTVAARLRRTPIEDLRKAIGLNQKFQFINDVFKGDSTAYNLLIDEVNSAASFEHAMIILSSAHPRFEIIDDEDAVVVALIQLVERRFV